MDDMLDYIKKCPEMVQDAINATKNANLPRYDFKRILVCGMGGSAIGGNLLTDLLRHDFKIPVEVSRRYRLPDHADKDTLVFVVSYSGNTEETLSQFVEARKRGLKIIGLSSGGYLKKWCDSLSVPFIELPAGFKPRAALPYLFFPMLEYIQQSMEDIDFSVDVEETIKVLETLRMDKEREDEIKTISGLIKNRRISIYGPEDFEAVVRRIKGQLNENSKLPSSWDVFPELNHNEIVGYEDNELNKENYVIILRDNDEHPGVKLRIDATKKIIQEKTKGIIEMRSIGKSKLSKLMSFVFLGDLLTYYLAKEEGKSPDKTDNIDELKRILKENLNMQEKLEKELV